MTTNRGWSITASRGQPPSRLLLLTAVDPVRPAERGWFPVISSDRVDRGIGNLGLGVVQAEVECWLDGVELLILDNLSSLTVGVRENDGDAWAQIQDWLLRLRRRGISVLIIHHAGKHGGQRGTSRREDVLDTSFSLRQPSDYTIEQGARFEVHIEKGRGLAGDHARPFEAQLDLAGGKAAWIVRDAEEAVRIRVGDDDLPPEDARRRKRVAQHLPARHRSHIGKIGDRGCLRDQLAQELKALGRELRGQEGHSSGPIPKFAGTCGTLGCELRNQRTT